MKKLLFAIMTLMLFVPQSILAVTNSKYEFALDIKSAGEIKDTYYPADRNIIIDVIAKDDLSTSADFGSFYISYNPLYFDFVSYNGVEGTAFDQNERKIYVSDSYEGDINFDQEEIIGTLVLKPKNFENIMSTNIEYYFYHELEPLFRSNTDITLEMPLSLENDIVIEKKDNRMLFVYVAGGIMLGISVVYLVLNNKNKHQI